MAVIATAAILAAVLLAPRSSARLPPLEKPIAVRFALSDGVRVSGQMTSCDEQGFDGSFGRRLWTELAFDDAWKLHQRVMDASQAGDWINLGRVMLLLAESQPFADQRAETAFRRAKQIDEKVVDEIERVREEVAEAKRAARDAARAAEAQKLTTLSPEAGQSMVAGGPPWPHTAWPDLNEEEQAGAINTVKADAEAVMKQAGVSLPPAETTHFIVYSELDRPQTAEIAMRLERIVTGLHFVLNPGVDPNAKDKPITIRPWGKIIVFIWKEQDRFKMVEAETFRHLVPNAAIAVAHYAGQRAFINCWREDDAELFEWSLIVETVHALMHSFETAKRLPAWANDGLAEMVASRANKQSLVGKERRERAIGFVRKGGDVAPIMLLKYEDGSFPGQPAIGGSVGGLILELMMNEKPVRLVRWMLAVKAGKEWATALREDYGSTPESIVEIANQYYRVND